jgi:hypothetical protein
MKKFTMLLAAVILMAGITATVKAQSTVTGTTAGAVIITPILLVQDAPLHFGVLSVLTGSGGTCVLSTANIRSATGGVNLSAQAPVSTNAAYHVTGQVSTTYALTLPATITVTHTTIPANTMAIGTLVARFLGAGADAVTSTLSAGGTDSFTVGGTLTVSAAQVAGVYSGTFNVTVAYN